MTPTPEQTKVAGKIVVLAFRHSRRWTQEQAAAWWGVTERQWRRYEGGSSKVPLPLLKRIGKSHRLN